MVSLQFVKGATCATGSGVHTDFGTLSSLRAIQTTPAAEAAGVELTAFEASLEVRFPSISRS